MADDLHVRRLKKANSVFFAAGLVLARLHALIQIPIVSFFLSPISFGLYALGYFLWLLEANLGTDPEECAKHPFSPAALREKITTSSVIGVCAAGCGIAAAFLPVLLAPALVLFMLSNFFWCWSEYQRYKQLPDNTSHPERTAKKNYFHYVCVATMVGALSSILAIIAFFVPLFLPYSLMLIPYLGGIVIAFWVKVTFFNGYDEVDQASVLVQEQTSMRPLLDLEKAAHSLSNSEYSLPRNDELYEPVLLPDSNSREKSTQTEVTVLDM